MGSAGNGGQHHVNYTSLVAPNNFGLHLHNAGYTTGMFGKWMNEYNGKLNSSTGAVTGAPGWDRWFAGMGYGNLTYVKISGKEPMLTENLLEDTGGFLRLRSKGRRRNSSAVSRVRHACCSCFLLTCALLMT